MKRALCAGIVLALFLAAGCAARVGCFCFGSAGNGLIRARVRHRAGCDCSRIGG